MLYRTTHHHPFIFTTTTFNPFSLSSLSSSPPSSLLLSSTVQEMECMQGAFKNGFGSETVSFADDFSAAVNGGGNAVSGDDLFVDELLDFSNDDVVSETEELLLEPEERELQELKACSDSLGKQSAALETKVLTPKDHFGSLPESESTDPVEGLESLEWLSHFVEDSFSEFSLAGKLPQNPVQNRPDQTANPARQCFATPVQTKARTKRARSGVRVWPILSSSAPSLADSSSISSSSSSNSSTTTSFPGFPFRSGPPPKKMQKRKPADVAGQSQQPRKCSHCGVTKTPQWRAGPRGLKTLCNACGVRFKSGRLLPEYRPACSPTFSSELHSNNHRKVLEMRKKKEFENGPGGLPQPVAPNF